MYIDNPAFTELNYNVLKQKDIYNMMDSSTWLLNGFYNYYELQKYLDFNYSFNPHRFDFQAPKINTLFFKNIMKNGFDQKNRYTTKTYKICMSSNIYLSDEETHKSTKTSQFILGLLEYTILRLAHVTF